MHLLDRFISLFSPQWAYRRMYTRDLIRAYDAAASDRRKPRKGPKNLSPQEVSREKRQKVLFLARDLERNNGWATGVFRSITANVIGDGIRPEIRMRTEGGELLQKQNTLMEDVFRKWADGADRSGKESIYEMQDQIEGESWAAGEVLAVTETLDGADARGRQVPLALKLYESEQLSDKEEEIKGGKIIQGVEYDLLERPVAYHIWPNHPSETNFKTLEEPVRIPADRVMHLGNFPRIGAPRGISRLHPVANVFAALAQYLDFELTRARVSSAWALLWKRSDLKYPNLKSATLDSTDENDNPLLNIEGGTILTGGIDDALESAGPSFQNTAFEAFVVLCLHHCASGLNVSYELLARDFTRTTFSSARQSTLEDIKQWRKRQRYHIRRFGQPTFNEFARVASLAGIAPYTRYQPEEIKVEWRTPGWDWVDPKKEVEAEERAVANGFKSPQQIAAQRGGDYYEIVDQIAEAKDYAEARGIKLAMFRPPKPDKPEDKSDDEDPEESGKKAEEERKGPFTIV